MDKSNFWVYKGKISEVNKNNSGPKKSFDQMTIFVT